jgi:hypothetical protein
LNAIMGADSASLDYSHNSNLCAARKRRFKNDRAGSALTEIVGRLRCVHMGWPICSYSRRDWTGGRGEE